MAHGGKETNYACWYGNAVICSPWIFYQKRGPRVNEVYFEVYSELLHTHLQTSCLSFGFISLHICIEDDCLGIIHEVTCF